MFLGGPLLDALDRMSYGGLLLDASGGVVRLNATAERHLREHAGMDNLPRTNGDWTRALRKLLGNRITRSAERTDFWLPIPGETERSLILYSRRLRDAEEQGPHTMVILLDLSEFPKPSLAVLQKIFDLTAAEARLAMQLAGGASLAQIAAANEISIATLRTQLASIFAKTNTSRQQELIALLARLSILP